MRDLGQALDFSHRHDVDAILLLADGEADDFGLSLLRVGGAGEDG
jgi:hypothetical protein